MEEGNVTPRPKRKYTPRPICTDPDLKYLYKKKPGPKKNHRTRRARQEFEGTDAEARRRARHSARVKKIFANHPELRELHGERLRGYARLQKLDPAKYSRVGVPDGMTKAQAQEAWAVARVKAERLFTEMVEKGIVPNVTLEDYEVVKVTTETGSVYEVLVPKTDDAKAAEALKEAMVMALGPMTNQQVKLGALNTVLKFTKSPPAQKLEVSKAEDLLAAAIADMKKEDGDSD